MTNVGRVEAELQMLEDLLNHLHQIVSGYDGQLREAEMALIGNKANPQELGNLERNLDGFNRNLEDDLVRKLRNARTKILPKQ